jgi:lysophospholipase L1-like esterase
MKISTTGGWAKHNVMMRSDSTFPRKNYGILGSCARLESKDSVKKGAINYKISKYSYLSARHFKWSRLFFGHGNGQFKLSIFEQDKLLLTEMVNGSGPLNYFGLQLGHTPENLTFEVEGDSLPCFYALSLDQTTGIAVDNIAWRGSRGAEFYKIQSSVLSRFFRQLNVKMIIFQFGVNVVPLITNNYNFYERQLIRQLTHLKNAAGEIPILVVGVSDMARKENGWYASYPNIEKIRNAQRNAAFKSNCAFWDMYKAMGGKNSMPSWVFAQPPLAQKDFTHFNFNGAKIIAQMLYNAIMYEFNNYKSGEQQQVQEQAQILEDQ